MGEVKVLSSKEARARWRNIMEIASAGEDVVIKRYGKPTAAVIPFEDYLNLHEELEVSENEEKTRRGRKTRDEVPTRTQKEWATKSSQTNRSKQTNKTALK